MQTSTELSIHVRHDQTHTLRHLSIGKEMLRDKAVGSSVHTDFSTEQQNRVCLLVAGHMSIKGPMDRAGLWFRVV